MRIKLFVSMILIVLTCSSCMIFYKEYVEKKAKRGDPMAQNNLGAIYAGGGHPIPVNYEKAMEWYQKASKQGVAEANYNIGDLYFRGLGVPRNLDLAYKYYHKAALQGFAAAQNNIGVFNMNGIVVQKNDVEAYMWFILAEKDFRNAKKNIKILKKSLSETEIENAVQKANVWKPIH